MPSIAGRRRTAVRLVPLARRPLAGECLANRRFLRKHRFAKRLADFVITALMVAFGNQKPIFMQTLLKAIVQLLVKLKNIHKRVKNMKIKSIYFDWVRNLI